MTAGGDAAGTGLVGVAAEGGAGLAGGTTATGFATETTADDAFCWGSDVVDAAGLGNPAGIGKDGGAATPKMVLPNAVLSINFPVVGQVRVSGRCCFSQ